MTIYFRPLIVTAAAVAALASFAGPAAAQQGHGRPVRGVVAQRAGPFGFAMHRPRPFIFGAGRPVFVRPPQVFRPRFGLGLGLIVGHPFFPLGYGYYRPYPYGYSYGYDYPSAYSYGYPYADPYGYSYSYPPPVPSPYGSYGYTMRTVPGYGPEYSPSSESTYGSAYGSVGSLSLDVAPKDAAVFVDGKYIGTVEDFSPTQAPVKLAAGRHHVDLRAQGYQTLSFDITVVAGQLIPYKGTMVIR